MDSCYLIFTQFVRSITYPLLLFPPVLVHSLSPSVVWRRTWVLTKESLVLCSQSVPPSTWMELLCMRLLQPSLLPKWMASSLTLVRLSLSGQETLMIVYFSTANLSHFIIKMSFVVLKSIFTAWPCLKWCHANSRYHCTNILLILDRMLILVLWNDETVRDIWVIPGWKQTSYNWTIIWLYTEVKKSNS